MKTTNNYKTLPTMKTISNYPSIRSLKSEREQRAEFNAEMARIEKQTFALQIVTAFCVGASVALAFVIAHQMIVTEWTW